MVKRKRSVRKRLIIVLAIVAVLSLGYAHYAYYFPDVGYVKQNLVSLYQLSNPGTLAEVVSLSEDSGLYHVVLKLTGAKGVSNYAEAWVTKDGSLLTQSVIFVKESISQMLSLKNFVNCLDGKGLRIYGFLNQTVFNQTVNPSIIQDTSLQLNTLGASSLQLYVPCELNFQACLSMSNTFPFIYYNNQTISVPQSISALGNITGCKFG